MLKEPKISLIIPAYNEEKRLNKFLRDVIHYYERHQNQIREIIIVDDGSTDQTKTIPDRLKKSGIPMRVLSHKVNLGKGAAVKTGVSASRGNYIVFMDADGATPIGELPKMINALASHDIAVGNRWLPGAVTQRHSALRRLSGWSYRTYMRLFHLGKVDTMCGFKGYRRHVAVDLFHRLQEPRWLFDTEIAYRAVRRQYSVANVPIRWTSQDGSKLSTWTLIKSAFRIWPLIRRIKKQERKINQS
ncbi:MAG: glycosyltransferase family 2 protein [bacterium]|nr:glycosyltransferase family 2 protein [bacterium]MDZ4344443.1 dolichyl-phosphate beta-glucosyltransferase [Candidatus Binatia bacterium]